MEKTTLKHVSKEFGMKANEFAETIGYTPQALNTALRTGETNSTRMLGALKNLENISNKMYMQQVTAVGNARSRRDQVIKQLAKFFKLTLN